MISRKHTKIFQKKLLKETKDLIKLAENRKLVSQYLKPKEAQELCIKCLYNRLYIINNWHDRIISDPIYGNMSFTPDESILIDTCYMQRLRRISQTSFLKMVFPAANHTRFDHSLGVTYVTKRIFNNLVSKNDVRKFYEDIIGKSSEDLMRCLIYITQKTLIYSALLHDIGHHPLSHISEPLACLIIFNNKDKIQKEEKDLYQYSGKPHEIEGYLMIIKKQIRINGTNYINCIHKTLNILMKSIINSLLETITIDKEIFLEKLHLLGFIYYNKRNKNLYVTPSINRIARQIISYNEKSLEKAYIYERTKKGKKINATILVNKARDLACKYMIKNPFHQIINSTHLDADKIDYLLRDAYFAGFDLTRGFNLDRLISGIRLTNYQKQYVISVEEKVLADLLNLKIGKNLLENYVIRHPVNIKAIKIYRDALLKASEAKKSKIKFYREFRKNTDDLALNMLVNVDKNILNLYKHRILYKKFCVINIKSINSNKPVIKFDNYCDKVSQIIKIEKDIENELNKLSSNSAVYMYRTGDDLFKVSIVLEPTIPISDKDICLIHVYNRPAKQTYLLKDFIKNYNYPLYFNIPDITCLSVFIFANPEYIINNKHQIPNIKGVIQNIIIKKFNKKEYDVKINFFI